MKYQINKKTSSRYRAIIDFADEDLPKEIYKNIREQNKNIYKQIENIIERSTLSRQIHNGFKITIIGKPKQENLPLLIILITRRFL